MSRYRGIVTIERSLCKGCSLCAAHCPLGILHLGEEINQKGYHPAVPPDPEKCTGCGLCALMCPEACILVCREAAEKRS